MHFVSRTGNGGCPRNSTAAHAFDIRNSLIKVYRTKSPCSKFPYEFRPKKTHTHHFVDLKKSNWNKSCSNLPMSCVLPFFDLHLFQDLLKESPPFFKTERFLFSQHLKIKTPISPPAARNEACFEVVLATYGRYLFLMKGFILKSQLLPQNSAGQTANFNQSRELLNSFFVFLEEMFKFCIWIIFSLVTLLNTHNIH